MQYTVTFTRYDTSEGAKKFRYTVARKTIVLLRSVVSVLQFPSKNELSWTNPILKPEEKQALVNVVGQEDDNFRVPMILAMCKYYFELNLVATTHYACPIYVACRCTMHSLSCSHSFDNVN
jgi:hypothetical protein